MAGAPAAERLRGDARAGLEVHDRLVREPQTAVRQRLPELVLERRRSRRSPRACPRRRRRRGRAPATWPGTWPGRASRSRSPPGPRAVATPIDARTVTTCPPRSTGARSASSIRWATSTASRSSVNPSSNTENSSPPSRAAVSPARSASESRVATAISSSSPRACPRESLIVLKPSRSRNNTPTAVPDRTARCSACRSRSTNSERFGSSVNGSCSARCTASAWLRASVNASDACSANATIASRSSVP